MPSTSSTTRVRYLIFCNAANDPSVSNTQLLLESHHTLQVSMYISPYMEAVMPVKYQHFHCKDPSAMFFFRWRPHCWWLEKNTAAWNPDQHEDCVKCSNLTLSLQILSWNVVKSQKLKHLDPPASEILSFCSVFRLYVSFDWSSTEPKLPFLEIRGSCRSISFQGISKDRTLMNESLCSLSMLWRFRLGCFFFQFRYANPCTGANNSMRSIHGC